MKENLRFDEAELLSICKELDIEVSQAEGYSTLNGVELTPELIAKLFAETSGLKIELPFYAGQKLFLVGRDGFNYEPKIFSYIVDSVRIGYKEEVSLYGRVFSGLSNSFYCRRAITIGKNTVGRILFFQYEEALKVFEKKKIDYEKRRSTI